jgi:hypothetical protein
MKYFARELPPVQKYGRAKKHGNQRFVYTYNVVKNTMAWIFLLLCTAVAYAGHFWNRGHLFSHVSLGLAATLWFQTAVFGYVHGVWLTLDPLFWFVVAFVPTTVSFYPHYVLAQVVLLNFLAWRQTRTTGRDIKKTLRAKYSHMTVKKRKRAIRKDMRSLK